MTTNSAVIYLRHYLSITHMAKGNHAQQRNKKKPKKDKAK